MHTNKRVGEVKEVHQRFSRRPYRGQEVHELSLIPLCPDSPGCGWGVRGHEHESVRGCLRARVMREATDLSPVVLGRFGGAAQHLFPDYGKEGYLASKDRQRDEEAVEGIPISVVHVHYRDAPKNDIPERHVVVVVVSYLVPEDPEDADEGFGDCRPMSEAGPEVAV